MIIKTTGNGAITQYSTLESALQANDPFRRYARHVGSAYPWCAYLELDNGAPPQCRSGEDTQLFQFERMRPQL